MIGLKHCITLVALGSLALLFQVGCEHGSPSSGFNYGDSSLPKEEETTTETTATSSFVGTWKLTPSEGGTSWYAFFYANGSWKICDNADGSSQRVYGSYSVSGATLNGNMTNPGVGTGAIVATVSDGVMTLDFIEYWHTPNKTVRYTGSKI